MDKITPIRITDKESGEVYELDFNRESVSFAERNGFKLEDVADFPATKVKEIFFYAFRAHHKKMSRGQTDKILEEKLHGLTPAILERLIELYQQAVVSNNIQDEDELAENPLVTVEL